MPTDVKVSPDPPVETSSDPVVVVVAPELEPEPTPDPVVVIAPEPSEMETRVREIENRLNLHDVQLVECRQLAESRAPSDHDHPMPPNLARLSEHLDEMEADDVPPSRRESIFRRRLF
jgi:hypothetical protein